MKRSVENRVEDYLEVLVNKDDKKSDKGSLDKWLMWENILWNIFKVDFMEIVICEFIVGSRNVFRLN